MRTFGEEKALAYLAALDRASIDMRIEPFAEFIAERVRGAMKQATAKARVQSRGRAPSA